MKSDPAVRRRNEAPREQSAQGDLVVRSQAPSKNPDATQELPPPPHGAPAHSLPNVFQKLREFMMVVDSGGTIQGLWSSNSPELANLEVALLGHRLGDAIGEGKFAWITELMCHAIESGRREEEEYPVEFADGVHTFTISAMPVAHEAGQPKGVHLRARDITEQKKTREALHDPLRRIDQTLVCVK